MEKSQHSAQKRHYQDQARFNSALKRKKRRDAEIKAAHERMSRAELDVYCGEGDPGKNQAMLAKIKREYRADVQRILDKLPIASPEDYWALSHDEFINGENVGIHSYKTRIAKGNARKRHAATDDIKRKVLTDWRKDEKRSNREYASKAECARTWAKDPDVKKALRNPQATIYRWLTRL